MKELTAKNMEETLVNWCGGDSDEFERIYYMFAEMASMGFVDEYNWLMFGTETRGWIIEGDFLIDSADDDKIIFDFDNGRNGGEYQEYRA